MSTMPARSRLSGVSLTRLVHVSLREHRLPHALLWEAGTPGSGSPARPTRLPYRRGLGFSAHRPSGTRRPAELLYPRDERTGRGPVIAPSGTRRIQRASAGGTRVSLPQRPAVFGFFPLSQKARADHGPADGHDRLFTRLCGPRIPHPYGPQGARRDLPRPKRQTHSKPDRTLGVPLLRGDTCALHPRTRPHDAESDRRAPVPAPTPGKAVCLVLSLKMHPNQALGAEWRLKVPECLHGLFSG